MAPEDAVLYNSGMEQEIRFCTARDGARLAYASAGRGRPLLMLPGWLSHLEIGWPQLSRSAQPLLERYRLIRYDKRGTGLSDRTIGDCSLEARLDDFSQLVEHLGLERFAMHASSAGGPVAVLYAAAHSERVETLVLQGSFARGDAVAGQRQTSLALTSLVRAERDLASAALTELFIPGASAGEREAFAAAQRAAAEADVAACLLEATASVDVSKALADIRCPTLVVHVRRDRAVPFEFGRELAAGISGARLLALDGDRHSLDAAAEAEMWQRVLDFLESQRDQPGQPEQQPVGDVFARFTARELDVLRLLAVGKTNQQIAGELFLSPSTVAHHLASIYAKAGVENRTQAAAFAHRAGLS